MLDDLTKQAEKKASELKKKGEELTDKAKDTAMRAVGKVKGQFSYPKTENESTLLRERTWFMCSNCNSKLGPVSSQKWKKTLKVVFGSAQIALGAATANPLLIAGGSVGIATQKRSDKGFIGEFKKDRQKKETAKRFLVQCEYCGEWLCSGCWNTEKNVCSKCSGKGLESILGL